MKLGYKLLIQFQMERQKEKKSAKYAYGEFWHLTKEINTDMHSHVVQYKSDRKLCVWIF